MSSSQAFGKNEFTHHDIDDQETFISQLPRARSWLKPGLCKYEGIWFPTVIMSNIINFQRDFKARDQDIILVSKPKTGTTWLKALLFSIVNRNRFTPSNTPLLNSSPHQLVPYFEFTVYADGKTKDQIELTDPRIFATHMPSSSLPESIVKTSKSKIVYVARNPFDAIVSFCHFVSQDHPERDPDWTMEDIVDAWCQGRDAFGPFWDHVLEFWKESQERPEKVLFLTYEDMKLDVESQVKKIAEFIGLPFSEDEEQRGVVGEICELCSLKSLKALEVKNKIEAAVENLENSFYYRNGQVGNWVNELTPSMIERIEKVIQEKMGGSSLALKKSL